MYHVWHYGECYEPWSFKGMGDSYGEITGIIIAAAIFTFFAILSGSGDAAALAHSNSCFLNRYEKFIIVAFKSAP